MSQPRKDVRFTLRMRRDQREQLDRAAAIESSRRPNAIEAGSLLLELAMPGVEQILASHAGTVTDRRHGERRSAKASV